MSWLKISFEARMTGQLHTLSHESRRGRRRGVGGQRGSTGAQSRTISVHTHKRDNAVSIFVPSSFVFPLGSGSMMLPVFFFFPWSRENATPVPTQAALERDVLCVCMCLIGKHLFLALSFCFFFLISRVMSLAN